MPLININQLTDDLVRDTAGPTRPRPPAHPGPAPQLPGDPVRALAARTAVRQWTARPLHGDVLLRALHYAHEQDAHLWHPDHPDTPAPTAAVLVRNVTGIRPGYYHYEPRRPALLPQPQSLPDLQDLVLQLEFADAAAVVLVLGDLAAALTRDGAAGHRQLLSRGAAHAHAAWLAALSQGAAGTVFAGILSSAGRTELGIDGFHRAQLLGLALGVPPTAPDGPKEDSR
ncbi:hypothetical protein [Streptomyces sp. x-80]|uniref:hypothetical protein n=1 Tax=Streptomyces sp. x-80 TaxID=2789282 RepID=UPI00397FD1FD